MNVQLQTAEIARIANALHDMCGDDERCYEDMLAGETDLHKLVNRLHDGIATDLGMVAGIKMRQGDLSDRKSRLEARIDAQRGAVISLLQAGRVNKVELPEATYSLRDGKPKLTVIDDDAVPAEYQRTKVETDKTAINDAFADAGELPNWLTREAAKPVLTMRAK